ncbi:helix-turn-helix domain-containing protein [Chryseobacterium balustinum]|uniref:helix-turn-helix domain-containing protein n=1 Tax=Chryseobacterium balustinum TaxID=246 RepID=UPI003CF01D2E
MTLGQNITIISKKLKLSQSDLGKAVGTSGDIIGRYERDEVKPSIEIAIKIADALQVSLDYLVGKLLWKLIKILYNVLRRLVIYQNLLKIKSIWLLML